VVTSLDDGTSLRLTTTTAVVAGLLNMNGRCEVLFLRWSHTWAGETSDGVVIAARKVEDLETGIQAANTAVWKSSG
jgi:hypothetical protein